MLVQEAMVNQVLKNTPLARYLHKNLTKDEIFKFTMLAEANRITELRKFQKQTRNLEKKAKNLRSRYFFETERRI